MGTPQQQAATAIANLLGRVGRFAVVVGVGGGIAQTSLYTGEQLCWLACDHLSQITSQHEQCARVAYKAELHHAG